MSDELVRTLRASRDLLVEKRDALNRDIDAMDAMIASQGGVEEQQGMRPRVPSRPVLTMPTIAPDGTPRKRRAGYTQPTRRGKLEKTGRGYAAAEYIYEEFVTAPHGATRTVIDLIAGFAKVCSDPEVAVCAHGAVYKAVEALREKRLLDMKWGTSDGSSARGRNRIMVLSCADPKRIRAWLDDCPQGSIRKHLRDAGAPTGS